MGLYILLYSPYFFACYAGRCKASEDISTLVREYDGGDL